MKITKPAILGLTLGLSFAAACRGSSSDNNGVPPDAPAGSIDAGNGSGSGSGSGSNGGVVHIQDVQSDTMPANTAVELHGVVVVSVDNFGAKTGDMFIEEAGGGARSGIHVFRPPAMQIANLVPGDIIDIKGAVKTEFPTPTPVVTPSVTSVTELKGTAMVITKTGHGAVPAPHVLDAAAISAMSATDRAAFLEDWEGVLVTLQNVRPDGAPTSFATPAVEDSMTFGITNVLGVDSNLSAFPTGLDNSVCLASVTGVVDFVAAKYVLYPPSTDQFVAGGTACPPPTVFTQSTIAEVQSGVHTGNVKLTGVFVTAVGLLGGNPTKTIWVSDTLLAAPGTGVEVFNATIDAGAQVVGAKVDVQGTVLEFLGQGKAGNNTLTEIQPANVTLSAAPTDPVVPLAVTLDQVNSITDSEAYEGTLVTITNVKVTAIGQHNQVLLMDSTAAKNTLTMDDDVFVAYGGTTTAPLPPAVDTCFASVTGVMDVQTVDNVRTINPRNANDMVPGGTCN